VAAVVEPAGFQVVALVVVEEPVAPRAVVLVAAGVEAEVELGERRVVAVAAVGLAGSRADLALLQAGWGGLVGSVGGC
jgi:hypothetical protein